MTADDFRELALSFPEAMESAHMHHPDFRVSGKIFATLGYPDDDWAVVKLTPNEQKRFVRSDPNVFKPVKGAWRRRGNTSIQLPAAKIDIVREALTAAWRSTAAETARENLLAQTDRGADAGHDVVGDFVGALGAANQDIVDV